LPAAPLAPEMTQRHTNRDGAKPTRELPLFVVAPDGEGEPDEHVLHDILGGATRARQPEGDTEQPADVLVIEFCESGLIAAAQPLDDCAVIHGRIVAAWHEVGRYLAHSKKKCAGLPEPYSVWAAA